MTRKMYTLGCLTMLMVFLAIGTSWAKSIRIGLMCPLTGSWASEGQDMKQIVELLAAETNKAGGIGEPKSNWSSKMMVVIHAKPPWPPPA